MPGRKKTRAVINAQLAEIGMEPLQDGQPIPKEVLQAKALNNRASKIKSEVEDTIKRTHARAPNSKKPKGITEEEIKYHVEGILTDIHETGTARIAAAKTLLEARNDVEGYAKSVLSLTLMQMAENQEELDKKFFDARKD